MENTRICRYCGKAIERKRNSDGRNEPFRDFNRRKFCDRTCSAKHSHGKKESRTDLIEEAKVDLKSPDTRERLTAVQFLESIINDRTIDLVTRVNAAKALLPYQEKKPGSGGKKEQQKDAAKEAARGKFAPMAGPKVVGIKRGE